MLRWMLVFMMAFCLTSCGNKMQRLTKEDFPEKAENAKIDVYYGKPIGRANQEIAIITREAWVEHHRKKFAIESMKSEARKLGADAIIIEDVKAGADGIGRAIAIRYK